MLLKQFNLVMVKSRMNLNLLYVEWKLQSYLTFVPYKYSSAQDIPPEKLYGGKWGLTFFG